MSTQFEKVMVRLNIILDYLMDIQESLQDKRGESDKYTDQGQRNEDGEQGKLFGDDPFNDQDYDDPIESEVYAPTRIRSEPGTLPRPSVTRHHVQVHNLDGGIEMVAWNEIDPRIIEAIRLSAENHLPWQLYRDPSGMIRVSVDASIAHKLRKASTYQQPVPRVGNREVDALGGKDTE